MSVSPSPTLVDLPAENPSPTNPFDLLTTLLRTDCSGISLEEAEGVSFNIRIHLNFGTDYLVDMCAAEPSPECRPVILKYMARLAGMVLENKDLGQSSYTRAVPESLVIGMEKIIVDLKQRGESMGDVYDLLEKLDRDYQEAGHETFKAMRERVSAGFEHGRAN